jgi:hypothetical protein
VERLPSLDPSEFWDWAWSNMNEQIRADFGDDIKQNVDAKTIMRFARRGSSAVARFIRVSASRRAPPVTTSRRSRDICAGGRSTHHSWRAT